MKHLLLALVLAFALVMTIAHAEANIATTARVEQETTLVPLTALPADPVLVEAHVFVFAEVDEQGVYLRNGAFLVKLAGVDAGLLSPTEGNVIFAEVDEQGLYLQNGTLALKIDGVADALFQYNLAWNEIQAQGRQAFTAPTLQVTQKSEMYGVYVAISPTTNDSGLINGTAQVVDNVYADETAIFERTAMYQPASTIGNNASCQMIAEGQERTAALSIDGILAEGSLLFVTADTLGANDAYGTDEVDETCVDAAGRLKPTAIIESSQITTNDTADAHVAAKEVKQTDDGVVLFSQTGPVAETPYTEKLATTGTFEALHDPAYENVFLVGFMGVTDAEETITYLDAGYLHASPEENIQTGHVWTTKGISAEDTAEYFGQADVHRVEQPAFATVVESITEEDNVVLKTCAADAFVGLEDENGTATAFQLGEVGSEVVRHEEVQPVEVVEVQPDTVEVEFHEDIEIAGLTTCIV